MLFAAFIVLILVIMFMYKGESMHGHNHLHNYNHDHPHCDHTKNCNCPKCFQVGTSQRVMTSGDMWGHQGPLSYHLHPVGNSHPSMYNHDHSKCTHKHHDYSSPRSFGCGQGVDTTFSGHPDYVFYDHVAPHYTH